MYVLVIVARVTQQTLCVRRGRACLGLIFITLACLARATDCVCIDGACLFHVLIGRTHSAVVALGVLMLGACLCHVLIGCTDAAVLAFQVRHGATGVDLKLMVLTFGAAIPKAFVVVWGLAKCGGKFADGAMALTTVMVANDGLELSWGALSAFQSCA